MLPDSQDTNSSKLHARFGTETPVWRLPADSDVLSLSGAAGEEAAVAVRLDPAQLDAIRAISGAIRHMTLDATMFGEPIQLHLVGRKTETQAWEGTACAFDDSAAIARNLSKGLDFAEQVVSEVNSLVVILDEEGRIKRFNRVCEEVTGFKEEEMIGQNAHELFMPPAHREASRVNIRRFFLQDAPMEAERPIRTKRGLRTIHWRNKLVQSGTGNKESFLVCSGTDVTEERRAQSRLVELANTDVLTGLPNRHAMQSLITEATSGDATEPFAVIFLDLDNFKKVNDHYGHLVGDKLIQEVAHALKACLREQDTIARIGGDEFLIAVRDCEPGDAEMVAERLLSRMKKPYQLDRAEIYSGCSVGVAMYPEHGTTLDELVRNADTAMYVAKEAGRQTYRMFNQSMQDRVREFIWLDNNLRRAIEESSFELHYQPKINLRDGSVAGAECLLRWTSAERGPISPAEFIPYAEESGLIVPLGQWVFETAARQAAAWKKEGRDLRVAFNLSVRQLVHPTLVDDFRRALFREGVYPSPLDVEITESAFMDDEDRARSLLAQFRECGAKIHLDDFGTGFSSLSKLNRLPLDVVKLDRSFILSIHSDERARSLVRAMAAVGQEMGLKIVAEGVETAEQASFLSEIGVDQAQGYLYGRPMPAEKFTAWLADWEARRKAGVALPGSQGAIGAA
jgi:c-di-GMP phosphodiesterase Gmr